MKTVHILRSDLLQHALFVSTGFYAAGSGDMQPDETGKTSRNLRAEVGRITIERRELACI